jgi:O-antigen ligase
MPEQWWKASLTGTLCFYFVVLCLFPSALDGLKAAIGVLTAAGILFHFLDRKFFLDPIFLSILAFATVALTSNMAGAGSMGESLKILSWTLPFVLGKAYARDLSGHVTQTLVIGAALLALYMAVALALSLRGIDLVSTFQFARDYLTLTFRHVTRTSLYIAVGCLICVHALLFPQGAFARRLAWPSLLTLFPALILSGRRMTVAAFLAVSALLLISRRKFLILGAGVAATLLCIVVLGQGQRFNLNPERLQKTQSVVERLTVWHAGWQIFKENPILGAGFGSFKEQAAPHVEAYRAAHPTNTQHENLEDAHNLILHVAAETGITGLTLILFIFASSIWTAWSLRERHPAALCLGACCLLIFLNSQLHAHLYSTNVHGLVFLLMGLVRGVVPILEKP